MKKNKSKIIKFYLYGKDSESFVPDPVPASRLIPEWYKKQPSLIQNEEDSIKLGAAAGTVKRCMPVFDSMTAGYFISFPVDVYIDATNPEKIEWSVPLYLSRPTIEMFSTHSDNQMNNYPIDTEIWHKQVFRIHPFWAIGVEEGYSILVVEPSHRDIQPFKPLPGLIDADGYVLDGNLSMLIKKGFKGVIRQGTPIIQIIPIKREDWQMQIVDAESSTKKILGQRLNIRSTFKHSYKEKFHKNKHYR